MAQRLTPKQTKIVAKINFLRRCINQLVGDSVEKTANFGNQALKECDELKELLIPKTKKRRGP